jgi:hypothetical protein
MGFCPFPAQRNYSRKDTFTNSIDKKSRVWYIGARGWRLQQNGRTRGFFNLPIVLLDHNGIAGAATMLSPFVSKSMMRVIAIVSDFPSLI